MAIKEVVLDTCFLERITNKGKNLEDIKKVFDSLGYRPVIPIYLVKYECDMYEWVKKLIDEEFLRVIEYNDIFSDEYDRDVYEEQFNLLHDELCEYIAVNSNKEIERLCIPKGKTIFDYRKAKSSMGDIHVVLTALYLDVPIILTEDSDITVLRRIVKSNTSGFNSEIKVYNVVDVLKRIATRDECPYSVKEMEALIHSLGKREYRKEIKALMKR